MQFADRVDAGRRLATRLEYLRGEGSVVLGLPRGGVPVALEVAKALDAPLDVIVVRKLGVPFQPELAMGAIGEGGVRVLNTAVVQLAGVSSEELTAVEQRERDELERRVRRFRGNRHPVPLTGKTVVIVDDGIATGSTASAACQVARAQGAARLVLAVPVAPPDWTGRLAGDADEFVCVTTPEPFRGVGQFYADFSQTSDDEVIACLEQGVHPAVAESSGRHEDDPPQRDEEIRVQTGSVSLAGHLTVPESAFGVVVFAHGSGSSRHSPRNRFVAGMLNEAGLATLLFDLLSPEEELDRANVFDIEVLARRLGEVTTWLRDQPETQEQAVGYFGASTGAAAALWAAAEPDARIAAVVSRGGRPDLAGPRLAAVTAPTLLIVGGEDHTVLDLNRRAEAQLRCESRLAVVPGATHLFEEGNTLQTAAELACDWFSDHLVTRPRPRRSPGVEEGAEQP
ncbi:MAG: phosphoribosyltransferase family protein [Acidimicrobiales bacterium]|jgi:putative phosphoribosyl transferase